MNFLAHLYLAGNDRDLLLGNFIADAVKGNQYKTYPPQVSNGILMHRAVDYFSDNHPVYLQSVHRLRPVYGKYSGVITDMFFDYFLAANWSTFSTTDLQKFCKDTYQILSLQTNIMPEESQHIFKYMSQQDWLYSYRTIEGIRGALRGMSSRMKYYFPMDNAISELENNSDAYNKDFLDFFPLLKEHVRGFKE